jgi:phosphatidylglycerophosphatase A
MGIHHVVFPIHALGIEVKHVCICTTLSYFHSQLFRVHVIKAIYIYICKNKNKNKTEQDYVNICFVEMVMLWCANKINKPYIQAQEEQIRLIKVPPIA